MYESHSASHKKQNERCFFFCVPEISYWASTHCCHPCETAQKETIYIAEESTESSINEEAAVCVRFPLDSFALYVWFERLVQGTCVSRVWFDLHCFFFNHSVS